MENETVFNEIEEDFAKASVAGHKDEFEFEFGDFSDTKKLVIQLKDEDKGKTFVIENVEIQRPRYTNPSTGEPIPPISLSKKNKDRVGYTSKLKITYKDSDYVTYLSGVKWFQTVSKGKKAYNPWFNIEVDDESAASPYVSEITKLFYKYCNAIKKGTKDVSRKEFVEGLVGKKVKLKQSKGKFDGKDWYRIDIDSIQ